MRPMTAPVPRGFVPRIFDFDGPAFGRVSGQLARDAGRLHLGAPDAGTQSLGHTSFLVRCPKGDVLLAGDVT